MVLLVLIIFIDCVMLIIILIDLQNHLLFVCSYRIIYLGILD